MIREDNTFVDLTNILDENNRNNRNNRKCKKYFKCKMPQFIKDLLNILIPVGAVTVIISVIFFLV